MLSASTQQIEVRFAEVSTLSSLTAADSVTTAAKQIASGAFSYYTTQNAGVGLFPGALFWESGSAWNALINYWFLTGDTTYNTAVQSALQAQSMDGFQPANQSNTMVLCPNLLSVLPG